MNRIERHPLLRPANSARRVAFFFDGEALEGFEGEPVSSTLIACGRHIFSRHARDGAPQGIFCANGQCSQCTMLIDGIPKKACMTPLAAGMDVRSLKGLPVLPASDEKLAQAERRSIRTDIFIIGGGPAGLAAAIELGNLGYQVVLADDKTSLGGKLVLQTHKFFGSESDCYAGVRGYEIAKKLEEKARHLPSVSLLSNAPVVGLYKDRKAGIFLNFESYVLVEFTALIVAAGAREKALRFPGWDLPGVIGAGAFQTLVNRDLVKPYEKIMIVGSGNVGLIAAYHALQAGIGVVGIFEAAGRISGYRVHADKIRRAGVPLFLNATIVKAEGDGRVERANVAAVDEHFQPIPGTRRTYDVDAVLVAVGLAPCNEFLEQARRYGIMAVAAGDAAEIAEASSAMYGGKTAAIELARMLGRNVEFHPEWEATRRVLASRPGDSYERAPSIPGAEWRPVFYCSEEIPCNPCATVCPSHSITLKNLRGTIMDLPYFSGERCTGCGACVAICPGLAITLVRRVSEEVAEVVLPWEFNLDVAVGAQMDLVDQGGAFVERAALVAMRSVRARETWLLTFRVSASNASRIAGIRARSRPEFAPRPALTEHEDSILDMVICRCERVTLREAVEFIRKHKLRDANQLKSIRVGMGACGGKTCSQLIAAAFALAGIDPACVEPLTQRPLFMEVPMGALVNEGMHRLGGKEAGARGAP